MPLLPNEPTQLLCLNHGFVRLVDVMGDDQRICDAARLSYANATRKMIQSDAKLIDYLLEHSHTSPFEQVVFTFHCKMPIFVARQWVRHRTARLNEFSGRYSEMHDQFYVPEESELKIQSTTNKQGRGPAQITNAEEAHDAMTDSVQHAFNLYQDLLESGMAKELARVVLPLSTYTEWYWQMDLHNLFHFLRLRMDSHAQYEIRVYAEAIYSLIKPYVPHAVASFERHVLNAKKFSADEMTVLRELIGMIDPTRLAFLRQGMEASDMFNSSNNRKVNAFFEKLGIPPA